MNTYCDYFEIRSAFQHYRSESYAGAMSGLYRSVSNHTSLATDIYKRNHNNSAPSSPKQRSNHPLSKSATLPSNAVVREIAYGTPRKSVSLSIGSFFKKLTNRGRCKEKPWIVVEFSQEDIERCHGNHSDDDESLEQAAKTKQSYIQSLTVKKKMTRSENDVSFPRLPIFQVIEGHNHGNGKDVRKSFQDLFRSKNSKENKEMESHSSLVIFDGIDGAANNSKDIRIFDGIRPKADKFPILNTNGASPVRTRTRHSIALDSPLHYHNKRNALVESPRPLTLNLEDSSMTMASMESCRLDSSTSAFSRSVDSSSYSLKSPALLSTALKPTINISGDETDRVALSEERFTSVAYLYISPSQDDSPQPTPKIMESSPSPDDRLPSYLGISCAISGYGSYSRFCHSRENSPARITPSPSSDINPQSRTAICDRYFGSHLSVANSLPEYNKASIAKRSFVSSKQITLSNGSATNGHSVAAAMATTTSERENSSSCKSLVQRRIESLFGDSQHVRNIAPDRTSRSKLRSPVEAKRSPSCPPETFRASSRSPPVFRHITKDFKEQLRNSPVPTKLSLVTKISCKDRNGSFKNNSSPPVTDEVIEEGSGHDFLRKMDRETLRIKAQIAEMESDLNSAPSTAPEDAMGKLRSAIGKANLLLEQKFKQFRDLCNKNITPDPTEPFLTTNGDLAGFWDMVLLQVDNVNTVFNDMKRLKDNAWKEDAVPYKKTPSQTRLRQARSSKSVSPSLTPPPKTSPSKSSEMAKVREEQRKKFLAAKKKATKTTAEIEIYTSENSPSTTGQHQPTDC